MPAPPSDTAPPPGSWRMAARTWRAIGRRWFLPVLLIAGPVIWAQRDR